jgi:hypothetical protein
VNCDGTENLHVEIPRNWEPVVEASQRSLTEVYDDCHSSVLLTSVFCANSRRNNLNTLYSSCASSSTGIMCLLHYIRSVQTAILFVPTELHSQCTDRHFVHACWVSLTRSLFWREPWPIVIKTLLNSSNFYDQRWRPFHLSSLLMDCAFSWHLLRLKYCSVILKAIGDGNCSTKP